MLISICGVKMKRLLRISFDIFLSSFTSILVWFVAGLLIDKNLTGTFSLTYSMQCLSGMLISVFATGANVCVYRDNNKNAADNCIVVGSAVTMIIYVSLTIFSRSYIRFMNMSTEVFSVFCRYSLLQIMLHTILSLVINKLYFLEKNSTANKLVIGFNLLNLGLVTVLALLTTSQAIIASITIAVLSVYVLIVLVKNVKKVDFKINFFHLIKYDSVFSVYILCSF